MNQKTKLSIKLVALLLVVLLLSMSVLLLVDNSKTASATTAGSNIVGGVDYSGQGTKINGDIRDSAVTVSGDRVNIPVWSYGSYVYNTWDEFWAGWTSWSPSNKVYYENKGYRYGSYYVSDADKKTEYQWYRDWPKTRDVYKTKYYREYEGNGFFSFHWGHSESSWSGYPTDKRCCKSKLVTRYEKYGTENYTEREYSYTYASSAPFRWAWDPAWKSTNPRDTYCAKLVNCWWDPNWKNESSEQVPLNYALKNQVGNGIGYGVKWTYYQPISTYKGNFSTAGTTSSMTCVQYYLTAQQIKDFLQQDLNKITNELAEYNVILNLLMTVASSGVAGIIAAAFSLSGPAAFAVSVIIALSTIYDAKMKSLQAQGINTLQGVLDAAVRENMTLCIEAYSHSVTYISYVGNVAQPITTFRGDVQMAQFTRNAVSMRYSDSPLNQNIAYATTTFGKISYVNKSEMSQIGIALKEAIQCKYPVLLAWNWTI